MEPRRRPPVDLSTIAAAVIVRLIVVMLSTAAVDNNSSSTEFPFSSPLAADSLTLASEQRPSVGRALRRLPVATPLSASTSPASAAADAAATTILATGQPTASSPSSSSTTIRQLYLATGLPGRLVCPIEDDPPNTLIMWLKDGRPVESRQSQQQQQQKDRRPSPNRRPGGRRRRRRRRKRGIRDGIDPGTSPVRSGLRGRNASRFVPRVKVSRNGILSFQYPDREQDEGVYTCLPYSPMTKGRESKPVRVLVRGKCASLRNRNRFACRTDRIQPSAWGFTRET